MSARNRRKSIVLAAATPQSQVIAPLDITKLYEDAMKIATENKINANNSWQLPLIDYFHDLDVLKDGDSINFQKASCTLDGCVKIYTSRVDSVDSETKKLMSGLADTHDLELDQDEEGAITERKTRTRKTAVQVTETNPEALNVKKFDSEFMVDPLFKKTCADFDEGGANGLLLNHLSIGIEGGIIFDASEALSLHTVVEVQENDENLEEIDMSLLSSTFGSHVAGINESFICPSLKDFQFSSANSNFDPQRYLEAAQDFTAPQNDLSDDEVGYLDDGGFGAFDDAGNQSIMPLQNIVNVHENAIPNMLSDMRTAKITTEVDEAVLEDGQDLGENDIFSYFDKMTMKNWMGPEMWKKRSLKKISTKEQQDDSPNSPKKRVKATLSFTSKLDPNELFAKPKTLSALDMPKTQQASKDPHLLPEDLMLSSKDFLSLFLKPGYTLKFKKKEVYTTISTEEDLQNQENLDSEAIFWADNEVQNAEALDFGAGDGGFGGEEVFGGGIDSDADSDAEEPPLTSEGPLIIPEEGDWKSQLVNEPRKVKTQFINYARVAKKVDVKLLKENLWKNLSSISDEKSKKEAPVEFTNVVTNLEKEYPDKKWKDISIPFCFICLLHLANENGLEIKGVEGGVSSELMIKQ